MWKLDGWARQGVLLLNPTLTVEVGRIGSHMGCGWQALTSEIVDVLCRLTAPPVFMLWGDKAQAVLRSRRSRPGASVRMLTTAPSVERLPAPLHGAHAAATSWRTADLVDWWAL